jgi:hypothetical protein
MNRPPPPLEGVALECGRSNANPSGKVFHRFRQECRRVQEHDQPTPERGFAGTASGLQLGAGSWKVTASATLLPPRRFGPLNTTSQHLDALLDQQPWNHYGGGARIGFIAYETASGLANLMTSVVFTLKNDEDDAATVRVGPFVLHVGYYQPAQVEAALRGLAASEPVLLLPDHKLSLLAAAPTDGRGWSPPYAADQSKAVLGWQSTVVRWAGRGVNDIMQVDEYSKAAPRLAGASPRSFPDWRGVARWAVPFLAQQGAFSPGWTSFLDIHLPTYVRLHGVVTDATTGQLVIHVDARHHSDRLATIIRDASGSHELARFSAADFFVNEECGHHCVSATLEPDTGPVRCDLILDGDLIEQRNAGVPPSPVRLYAGIDPEMKWLEWLTEKATKGKKDSASLERWVHVLLTLADLSVIHFGHGQDLFPDLVGWVFPNGVIAAEVTLTAPDLNKLVKLQQRVLSLRKAASSTVPPGVVFPVVFFSATSAEVGREIWNAAAQQGIALAPRERMDELHAAVVGGTVQGAQVLTLLRSWGARGWQL